MREKIPIELLLMKLNLLFFLAMRLEFVFGMITTLNKLNIDQPQANQLPVALTS